MSDQCKNCIVRGDIASCLKTPCHQHESWFAEGLQDIITTLFDATYGTGYHHCGDGDSLSTEEAKTIVDTVKAIWKRRNK